nr:MAG: ECF sigma factor [Bacteriophage sp.]
MDSATYEKLCFLLTDEEKAVLDLKRRGFGNAEIAAELNLSERTVNRRVKAIVGKLKAG